MVYGGHGQVGVHVLSHVELEVSQEHVHATIHLQHMEVHHVLGQLPVLDNATQLHAILAMEAAK